jgi:CheY-like chemotaxis protein
MAPAPSPPTPGEFRVLIVDDNAPSRRALARVLESAGYEIREAATGAKALEALAQDPPADFVLTDLVLPDLDGREVARAASQLPNGPFVALITGWSLEADLERLSRWGVDHVFLKPLQAAEILAKFEAVRSGRRGQA